MAEKDIDKLLALTDSKYRLSVIVAKRAIQLKGGASSVLPPEKRVKVKNLVTLSMLELATGKLQVGEGLMDEERWARDQQTKKHVPPQHAAE